MQEYKRSVTLLEKLAEVRYLFLPFHLFMNIEVPKANFAKGEFCFYLNSSSLNAEETKRP